MEKNSTAPKNDVTSEEEILAKLQKIQDLLLDELSTLEEIWEALHEDDLYR